ncbi:MAG: DUF4038 domain-containing protein [Bryobacteraceae bacterium]|nr:DUF4038 domain-containing protein [Bryobacteraceae bacterium]
MVKFIPMLFALSWASSMPGASVPVYQVFEAEFQASKPPESPLQLRPQVTFSTPGTGDTTVEAFWDGGARYRVRFQPLRAGAYSYKVHSSDPGLNGKSGQFAAVSPDGPTTLDQHGPPILSADRRHFTHADGTPWLWLADTAWNGALLATREEWGEYLKTRVSQRFSAVQFVMTQWRAGRADENGRLAFRSNGEKLEVDPIFFRRMDERVAAVRRAGLVPVPVMLWALTSRDKESPGAVLPPAQAAELARYINARYHAYSVLWMLGGDGDYRGEEKAARWREIGRLTFPAGIDRRPVTLHPGGLHEPWELLRDEPWLDFLTYQSGHGGDARKWQWQAYRGPALGWRLEPVRPVIDAEPNYEGHVSYHGKSIDAYAVRRAAWYSILAAPVAGVTYGAHGVWPWIRQKSVPLDHPRSGEADPWRECLAYPGAAHMKALVEILERLPWPQLRPDAPLAAPTQVDEGFTNYIPVARTLDGSLALAYLPANPTAVFDLSSFEKGVRATFINPRNGERLTPDDLPGEPNVTVKSPGPGDWLLLFERRK